MLYERLLADEFTGLAWEKTCDRLIRYGYAVLESWIRAGSIFLMCAEKGIRGLPADAIAIGVADGDVDDLCQDTVFAAVRRFRRDALAGRGWRPAGGASLRTYFVHTCLIEFSSVYRRYDTTRRRQRKELEAVAANQLAAPAHHGGIDAVLDAAAGQHILAAIPDRRLREAIRLTAEGHTHKQISVLLDDGTTPRAVEGMLRRYRETGGPR